MSADPSPLFSWLATATAEESEAVSSLVLVKYYRTKKIEGRWGGLVGWFRLTSKWRGDIQHRQRCFSMKPSQTL